MKQRFARWIGASAVALGRTWAHGAAFAQTDPAANFPDRQIRSSCPIPQVDRLMRWVAWSQLNLPARGSNP